MKNGFTIIELVITIFILSLAIVGIFNAFSVMVILTSNTADQLTATYLVQEGMEIVRNIRDTNWLKISAGNPGVTWVDGLASSGANNPIDCSNNTVGCEADYTETIMAPYVSGASNGYLALNGDGFYVYNPSSPSTKFKRKIIITPTQDIDGKSDHIINVTVQVAWDQKASVLSPGYSADDALADNNCNPHNCISTNEMMYNWYGSN
jgi:prepilin-type N-terminal cleavage/methylation domain-containing protein